MKKSKMKWIWYNIYHNESKDNILLDNKADSWYTKLWRRIKNYLNI